MQTIYENYVKQKEKFSFTDLDFAFAIHPVTKELVISTDSNAIRKSLRNLVMTSHYERLFHPEIGSNIRQLLFEPMTPLTSNYLETEIYNTITNYEPRVDLVSIDIDAQYDYNAYNISITYYEKNSTQPVTIDLLLERLR